MKLGQHLLELPSLEFLLAQLFLSPACDIKEGLVTEAGLLLATQEQMPPVRMLHARLAERRAPWNTTTLTIMVLSEQRCWGKGNQAGNRLPMWKLGSPVEVSHRLW